LVGFNEIVRFFDNLAVGYFFGPPCTGWPKKVSHYQMIIKSY